VAFVDHDAIVLIHRGGRLVLAGIQGALHHALYGRDMHGGVGVGPRLVQLLDAKDVGKGLEALHARVLEGVGRLFAERGPIHQEQYAAETFGFQQAIDERDTCFRFAGARGHGK